MSRSGLVLLCGWFFGTAATGVTAQDASVAEHPLAPVLQLAYASYDRMQKNIQDYTCTLTRHERVEGRLLEPELMQLKVRHAQMRNGQVVTPFGVYVRFVKPAAVEGREVLWVEGQYDNKLIVRNGGQRFDYVTLALPPDSELAMQRNRYPINQVGFQNLTRRLIENGQEELHANDCAVKNLPGAKINGRLCTLIQVSHPVRREHQIYQFARIMIDDELRLPVYYCAYDWPKQEGGPPRLLEEYVYSDIQLNVGLTDEDFDFRNERYHFRKSFEP